MILIGIAGALAYSRRPDAAKAAALDPIDALRYE